MNKLMNFISDIREDTKKKNISEGTLYALEKIYIMTNCLFISMKIRENKSLSTLDFNSIEFEYNTNKALKSKSNGLSFILDISK